MQVLKIEMEGLTASFRYAHFMIGRQPSYPMPPPATIYGHICSAVGDFVDPTDLRFAYTFTADGRGDDLEYLHLATVRPARARADWPYVQNLEVTANVWLREVLLHPHLTLYLACADVGRYYRAFREPSYAVVLGRSQDLMAYRTVEVVDLPEAPAAYFASTLLPWRHHEWARGGVGVLMPRFIDPIDRARVTWQRYVVLAGRIRWPEHKADTAPTAATERVSVDPAAPRWRELSLGLPWHTFAGVEPGALTYA